MSQGVDPIISRRNLLAAAGLLGGATAVATSSPLLAGGAPVPRSFLDPAGEPAVAAPVSGLHLQFGADASTEVVASWHTLQPVLQANIVLGHVDGRLVRVVKAETSSYKDAKSGQTVYAHHARLRALQADHNYLYAAMHLGSSPEFGTFRTAPKGRARLTFTSFGDQGTPTLGKTFVPPRGFTLSHPLYINDNLGSPAAADTALGIERVQPLFHLFNGDLSYANLAEDRVRTWWDFWTNNSRSARNRPWMPSPGNHENELGNGPIGYQAYQTYFSVPPAEGQTDATRGLWYAFTAGSVRVISIANDDVAYQDGGDSYVRGYSAGAQKAWLEKTLATARQDRTVDWIVVCMHQVAISSADRFNGADLGVREEWMPLFDRYGVDLVVCGHEHHYERSHPIRGQEANATLTPRPAGTEIDVIDTSKGTVHMVLGGGGTSLPSNELFYNPPQCRMITAVAPLVPGARRRSPIYVVEAAPWAAVRNAGHAYGFAAFTVDPGTREGGFTEIEVTYYDVVGVDGAIRPFESFRLRRPRQDSASSR